MKQHSVEKLESGHSELIVKCIHPWTVHQYDPQDLLFYVSNGQIFSLTFFKLKKAAYAVPFTFIQ